jgi:hypothetical protein
MNLVEPVKVTSFEEEAEKFLKAKGILKNSEPLSILCLQYYPQDRQQD